MLHRSKSIERPRPVPEPTYMSSKQAKDYLQNIRSQRIPRPQGARPPPPWLSRKGSIAASITLAASEDEVQPQKTPPDSEPGHTALPQRSEGALSYRRSISAIPGLDTQIGRSLVQEPQSKIDSSDPTSVTVNEDAKPVYQERGDRWMERQEAASIRRALNDMDLAGEQRLHAAAQDEASELVWKHQNPDGPYRNSERRYSYREHLRKGSHARVLSGTQAPFGSTSSRSSSFKRQSQSYDARPSVGASRKVSESSSGSKKSSAEAPSAEEKAAELPDRKKVVDFDLPEPKPYDGLSNAPVVSNKERRRSTSGSKRSASGSSSKGLFRNPEDQIYEESGASSPPAKQSIAQRPAAPPLQTRRNPFARVKSVKSELAKSTSEPLLSTKPLNRTEIYKNPPTQSRNAAYTSNSTGAAPSSTDANTNSDIGIEEPTKMVNGKEVRADDIRQATSRSVRDRSPKLPTPSYVSDTPGRPIVSFQQDWKPKEVILRQEVSRTSPSTAGQNSRVSALRSKSERSSVPFVPAIDLPNPQPSEQSRSSTASPVSVRETQSPTNGIVAPPVPSIRVDATSIPAISVHDYETAPARPSPAHSVSLDSGSSNNRPLPTINVSSGEDGQNKRPIPTVNISSADQIQSKRPLPTINVSSNNGSRSKRPLPTPSKSTSALKSRIGASSHKTMPHWTPSARGTSALCCQCALPIAGRVVSAAGSRFHPECFKCYHCGEGLECVAFYPEPDGRRAERVDRIRRRINGEAVPEAGGQTEDEDGDESARFYCHLDFHEMYSPRCKSCKTPIEGEVVVACGAEWHVGHFFCAQCGDPFDSQTPFVEKEGYAWCVNCHTNRYSTKCRKCKRPVTDTVVKALGAEWHAQCFCCKECGGQFDDGRYFLRGQEQDPVCVKCEERRLKI